MEVFPARHVLTFGGFLIDHAVPIQECRGLGHGLGPLRMAFVGPERAVRKSLLTETLTKRLGTRVVIGRPNVDEHPIVLRRVHPTINQERKDVLLKAGWSVREVL